MVAGGAGAGVPGVAGALVLGAGDGGGELGAGIAGGRPDTGGAAGAGTGAGAGGFVATGVTDASVVTGLGNVEGNAGRGPTAGREGGKGKSRGGRSGASGICVAGTTRAITTAAMTIPAPSPTHRSHTGMDSISPPPQNLALPQGVAL